MSVMTWFSILEQSVRALRRVHFSLIFIDELALIEELLCFFLNSVCISNNSVELCGSKRIVCCMLMDAVILIVIISLVVVRK